MTRHQVVRGTLIIKKLISKIGLPWILTFLTILANFVYPASKWVYELLSQEDVLVSVMHGFVVDDFIKEVRAKL